MTTSRFVLALLGIFLAPSTIGCVDRTPLGMFTDCVYTGVRSMDHIDQSEIDCAYDGDLLLVGLPNRKPTVEELVEAGLSKNVADIFATREHISDYWCAIKEFEPPPVSFDTPDGKYPLAEIECRSTELEIPRTLVAHSPRLSATLNRSRSGRVTLAKFEWR